MNKECEQLLVKYTPHINRMLRYKPDDWYSKPHTYIRDRLDEICSLTVRIRDNFRSVLSGSGYPQDIVQCGHIIERNCFHTRWFEANLGTQTAGENYEQESRPTKYRLLWTKYLGGEDKYDKLVQIAMDGRKMQKQEKIELYKYWQKRLKSVTRYYHLNGV